jgi:hypothetical protein
LALLVQFSKCMRAARSIPLLLLVALLAIPASEAAADDREVVFSEVSPKVAARLKLAAQAIRFVKRGIPKAGNQHEHVYDTKGNSYYRTQATRQTRIGARVESPALKTLASKDPLAARAATIAATSGGNCGEHSVLAMHYLSGLDTKQTLTRAGVQGVDHAFVLIGDLKNDPLHEIVVVDAWVTNPQPLLYSDFSFKKDRSQIRTFDVVKNVGNKTRQARRALTRGLRASFAKRPEPLLKKVTADHKNLKGLWFQEHASTKNHKYKVKGADGKVKNIKLTRAIQLKKSGEPAVKRTATAGTRTATRTSTTARRTTSRRTARRTTTARTAPVRGH